MKYKIGDLVRIKSMTWWNKNKPKNFPEYMANECCGRMGEIINSNNDGYCNIIYLVKRYWFMEHWVESKVGKLNIPLKQLKNEI